MVKLEDWKGNRIKPGDTIVIVRTKPAFDTVSITFSKRDEVLVRECAPDHIWEIIEELEVIGDENYPLIHTKVNGFSFISSAHAAVWLGHSSSSIVCIKGVSDNEQDYYTEYFKI